MTFFKKVRLLFQYMNPIFLEVWPAWSLPDQPFFSSVFTREKWSLWASKGGIRLVSQDLEHYVCEEKLLLELIWPQLTCCYFTVRLYYFASPLLFMCFNFLSYCQQHILTNNVNYITQNSKIKPELTIARVTARRGGHAQSLMSKDKFLFHILLG